MYGGFQLNGIPDLSFLNELNFSNNLNALAQPVPGLEQYQATQQTLNPTPAPASNPYANMTQADLAEIGMMAALPQVTPTPTQTPVPTPQVAVSDPNPVGIETMAPNFSMTEDFAMPVDQQLLMPAMAPASTSTPTPTPTPEPNPAGAIPIDFSVENFTPDVGSTLQNEGFGSVTPPPSGSGGVVGPASEDYTEGMASVPSNTYTLPNGETLDLTDINLGALNIAGLGSAMDAAAQNTTQTPAQTANAAEDLANIPTGYFTAASDYYTDGQLAEMGDVEPGTAVSTGANPQQPAGTVLDLTPEQQGLIDEWVANNPPGTIIQTPVGNVSLPDLTNYTSGGSSNPPAASFVIQNLIPQVSETARGGRVATMFGGSGELPQQQPRANPFQRPTEGGIASLVPTGG